MRCWSDVVANFKETRADGIMSAEGILDDPSLYFEAKATRQQLLEAAQSGEHGPQDGAAADNDDRFVLSRLPPSRDPAAVAVPNKKPSRLELAAEYLTICAKYPVKQRCGN